MRASLVAILMSLCAAPAAAFHGQADFDKPALEGGGGGRWFTGSPRFRRWDCTVCHADGEGLIGLTLATEPPGLVRDGVFVPGATYAVTVTLQGEHRGLDAMLNPNTFVLEIVDEAQEPAGIFAGLGSGVERPPGEELVVARGEFDGATEWSFEWIAPEPGSGPVTLYLAGVDGDGAGDRLGRTGDPFGDDVFVGSMRLQEEGNVQDGSAVMTTGCSAGGARSNGEMVWLYLFGSLLVLLSRDRRARRGAAQLALAVLLYGCHDPSAGAGECVRGICETADRDASSGVPGSDGGGATIDAGRAIDAGGVMRVDSGVDAGPPPDGCVQDWLCTAWSVVCGDDATRTCTDANGCGSDWGRPAETQPLAALDESFYRCRVQPIFDRSCSQLACHGTEDRPLRTYSRVKWRINPAWRGTHNAGGDAALTGEEWCRNLSSARLFAGGDPAASQLLTQPLSPSLGGLAHAGYTLFYETSDPDYQTIREWLSGASLPSCDAGFND